MTTREFIRKLAVDVALMPLFFAVIFAAFAVVFWVVTTLTPPVTP